MDTLDVFIKTRVTQRTKSDFFLLCTIMRISPSEKLRCLVEAYVEKEICRVAERVKVHIYRPHGCGFETWRIKIVAREARDALWGGAPIPFALPSLGTLQIQPDDRYIAVLPENKRMIGGKFVDGLFEGRIFENGITDEGEACSIDEARETISQNLNALFARFTLRVRPDRSRGPRETPDEDHDGGRESFRVRWLLYNGSSAVLLGRRRRSTACPLHSLRFRVDKDSRLSAAGRWCRVHGRRAANESTFHETHHRRTTRADARERPQERRRLDHRSLSCGEAVYP